MAVRFASSSLLLAFFISVPSLAAGPTPVSAAEAKTWDRFTAAKYLDARQQWWMDWSKAQRDHETACVSCHTAIPYAMARPSLRKSLKEDSPSAQEKRMLGYVVKRVTLWQETQPFYSNEKVGPQKTPESRGTESVLNALVLARYDEPTGHMREITKDAFANMWATQLTTGDEKGSWDWLNFHNAPWESNESHYWGATVAAVAIGFAPNNYRREPAIQPQLGLLRGYLNREYDKQPLINRIAVLWASIRIPGLLTTQQRAVLLKEIRDHQQADGGWTLSNLGPWKRRDNTPLDTESDGYATGLIVYVLSQAGVSPDRVDMKKATSWLIMNQQKDGHWPATSLNKKRDPASDPAKFMTDAATSYAVLALDSVDTR